MSSVNSGRASQPCRGEFHPAIHFFATAEPGSICGLAVLRHCGCGCTISSARRMTLAPARNRFLIIFLPLYQNSSMLDRHCSGSQKTLRDYSKGSKRARRVAACCVERTLLSAALALAASAQDAPTPVNNTLSKAATNREASRSAGVEGPYVLTRKSVRSLSEVAGVGPQIARSFRIESPISRPLCIGATIMSSTSDRYSVKLCEQRLTNGDPCRSRSLRDKRFCRFHEVMGPPMINIDNRKRRRPGSTPRRRSPPGTWAS